MMTLFLALALPFQEPDIIAVPQRSAPVCIEYCEVVL